jgi:hypothetical protein
MFQTCHRFVNGSAHGKDLAVSIAVDIAGLICVRCDRVGASGMPGGDCVP